MAIDPASACGCVPFFWLARLNIPSSRSGRASNMDR